MALDQGSILYGGSVSQATIYQIQRGEGLTWANHFRTEIVMDSKPRQLTRGIHAGNPISANIAMPRDADFANTDTVTIDGRNLSVRPLMVRDKIDILDWKETFPQYQPTGSNQNLAANPIVAQTFFNLIMNATKTQLNALHSVGDTGLTAGNPLSWYNGIVTKILADADATQVGTPAVLTAANIIDYIYQLRNAVPPRLRAKQNLKIFLSYADFDLYTQASAATQSQIVQTGVVGTNGINQSDGSRINIIPIEGIPKNFVFATIASTGNDSNLVQGVWTAEDLDALKVYKSEEADQVIKYVMRFDIGVEYVTGLDIFYLNNV